MIILQSSHTHLFGCVMAFPLISSFHSNEFVGENGVFLDPKLDSLEFSRRPEDDDETNEYASNLFIYLDVLPTIAKHEPHVTCSVFLVPMTLIKQISPVFLLYPLKDTIIFKFSNLLLSKSKT